MSHKGKDPFHQTCSSRAAMASGPEVRPAGRRWVYSPEGVPRLGDAREGVLRRITDITAQETLMSLSSRSSVHSSSS